MSIAAEARILTRYTNSRAFTNLFGTAFKQEVINPPANKQLQKYAEKSL